MAEAKGNDDVQGPAPPLDAATAAALISSSEDKDTLAAALTRLAETVEEGHFDGDPKASMPLIVQAARAKRDGGFWDRDLAQHLGRVLKAMKNPPPPALAIDDLPEVVINFVDAYESFGKKDPPKNDPEDFYQGRDGIHFAQDCDKSKAGYGVIGGKGNGDPGNWGLEGSNESPMWGVWGHYGNGRMTFDRPAVYVKFDIIQKYKVGVRAVFKLGGEQVGVIEKASGEGGLDGEHLYSFSFEEGPCDEVSWECKKAHGVDNVRFKLQPE